MIAWLSQTTVRAVDPAPAPRGRVEPQQVVGVVPGLELDQLGRQALLAQDDADLAAEGAQGDVVEPQHGQAASAGTASGRQRVLKRQGRGRCKSDPAYIRPGLSTPLGSKLRLTRSVSAAQRPPAAARRPAPRPRVARRCRASASRGRRARPARRARSRPRRPRPSLGASQSSPPAQSNSRSWSANSAVQSTSSPAAVGGDREPPERPACGLSSATSRISRQSVRLSSSPSQARELEARGGQHPPRAAHCGRRSTARSPPAGSPPPSVRPMRRA